MYYLLNYIPCIIQLVFVYFSHIMLFAFALLPFGEDMYFSVYIIMHLFVMPVYLLLVNCRQLLKKKVTFPKSIGFMLSVVVINVAIIMMWQKIHKGSFFGDVPEGLYYIALGIPSAIILIGSVLIFLLKSKYK